MLQIDQIRLVTEKPDSPAQVVGEIDEVRDFIPALLGHCRRAWNTPALAAPEAGFDYRVIVTYIEGDYGRIFINPVVVGYGEYDEDKKKHEHVSIHAINLKGEQFLLNTEAGYYEGREDIGRDMAFYIQDAYEWLEPSEAE